MTCLSPDLGDPGVLATTLSLKMSRVVIAGCLEHRLSPLCSSTSLAVRVAYASKPTCLTSYSLGLPLPTLTCAPRVGCIVRDQAHSPSRAQMFRE